MTDTTSNSSLEAPTANDKLPDQSSLLDLSQPPVSASDAPITTTSSDWAWAEGLKGSGDRPEWLRERYKSVSDQAKAYTDLEKKFGEFKGAPKEGYDFEKVEGLEKDSPLLQSFANTFKELNLSQQGFERVVTEFVNNQVTMIETDAKAEMKKLGPQGQAMLQQNQQWIKNHFPPDIQKTIAAWVLTAEDVKALDTLRAFMPTSKVPSAHDMSQTAIYESHADVKNEKIQNWIKYKEEPNYRKSLDDRLAKAKTRADAGKR